MLVPTVNNVKLSGKIPTAMVPATAVHFDSLLVYA